MFRSSWFYLLSLGGLLLVLAVVVRYGWAASKHFDEPVNASMRAALAAEQPELSTEESLAIDRLFPTAQIESSGLRYLVRNPGASQRMPRITDEVAVRYTGRFLNGQVFDHSDRFTFRVGMGDVIAGWDKAILEMKQGEIRTLIVPWWLAYGEKGAPPTIPPKTTLVFDVELLEFR
jgi:FKBP-type peptidyl-prolyl cis-trans isomerase